MADRPDVLTYRNQPGNVEAWRLGEACRAASPGGDLIDHGLSLLQQLQERGYGIVNLGAPPPERVLHVDRAATAAAPDGVQAVDDQAAAWLLLRVLQQAGPFPRELIDRTKDALQRMAAHPPLGGEDGAKDREDAARYRWLADKVIAPGYDGTFLIRQNKGPTVIHGESIDAAIDAARAAGGEGNA